MIKVNAPFVLLDDARAEGAAPARLYSNPIEVIEAHSAEQISGALERLSAAQGRGLHAAGTIGFEAGYALEERLAGAVTHEAPLLWFGLFNSYQEIALEDVPSLLPSPDSAWAGAPQPLISQEAYAASLASIKAYIAAGDIYQANLTFPCDVPFNGAPLALYAGLRARAQAGYGGVIFTGKEWLLSASPELFFSLHEGKLTTRPMKGTAARGSVTESVDDFEIVDALKNDTKQRAENLMIVDLLRNDLSRVAEAGSVRVPALFEIETYPTVHQMTSTVTAQIRKGLNAKDVLHAIFPCGSITGAPKIRAMQIIKEVERAPRGAYTGSIGRIDANGDAAFNVAIRTLQLNDGAGVARIGLGSGIVADSEVKAEWQECLDKGAFVASPVSFDLIETMRFDPDGGITLLDGHVKRLEASAKQFGFEFNRHNVRNALQAATIRHAGVRKLRLMLAWNGAVSIELSALPAKPDGVVEVVIAPLPVDVVDVRLRHKTSDRAFYDVARRAAQKAHEGAFEVLFTDPNGFLTEGSFTNIFVARDGKFLTPRAERGLLPGVFRAALLESGDAEEADLTVDDLAGGFFIGNALRGLIAARRL